MYKCPFAHHNADADAAAAAPSPDGNANAGSCPIGTKIEEWKDKVVSAVKSALNLDQQGFKLSKQDLCPTDPIVVKSSNLYHDELTKNAEEKELNVKDIQGDVILGFNKTHNVAVILKLKRGRDNKVSLTADEVRELKKRIKLVGAQVTTTADMIRHRDAYRRGLKAEQQVLFNISFGHECVQTLLRGTEYECTLSKFPSDSPYVIGATARSYLFITHQNGNSQKMQTMIFSSTLLATVMNH
jgi:hypothetical protein